MNLKRAKEEKKSLQPQALTSRVAPEATTLKKGSGETQYI